MQEKEIQSFFNKKFHYFNEYLSQAINKRNSSIDMAQRLMSVKASMKMHDHAFEIMQIQKKALEKIESCKKEFADLLDSLKVHQDNRQTFNFQLAEQVTIWLEIASKIQREADSLEKIADEVALSRFQVFDQLQVYFEEKGML